MTATTRKKLPRVTRSRKVSPPRFAQPAEESEDLHDLLITHAYPIAWLIRGALRAPLIRWLGLGGASTALIVIEYRPGMYPTIRMFNDLSHLSRELRWAGSPPMLHH